MQPSDANHLFYFSHQFKPEENTNIVSLVMQGYHGIDQEVFLSMPVIVGENGVNAIFNQKLSEEEVQKIKKSAGTLREIIDKISL